MSRTTMDNELLRMHVQDADSIKSPLDAGDVLHQVATVCWPNRDLRPLVQHSRYYLHDGNLHLLAENTHFRVHSYFFTRESTVFEASLKNPVSAGQDRKGSSDSNALVLDNVTAEDFAKFLWVFYDPTYSRRTTVDDWMVILELANRWAFLCIKELALKSLEELTIPLVERIALYQKYNAPEGILHPHYAALCARAEILSLEETVILGGATSIMVFSIRERILSGLPGARGIDQFDPKVFQLSVGSYFNAPKTNGTPPKGGQQADEKIKSDKKANGRNGKPT